MKTLKMNLTSAAFSEFVLSNEEMINVRGGENDPVVKVVVPPIII
jgi:hypothetical protein